MSSPMLMNPNLTDFWFNPDEDFSWRCIRYKILLGGRSSSKSHDACGALIYLSSNFKVKVLCTRMFQNKIAESVYALLVGKIEAFGLRDIYKITDRSIKCLQTGSEFIFYGIARNYREIKSLEGVDILYLEEAEKVTKDQWDILIPTIRGEGSEIWAVFNPDLITDFIYQKFVVKKTENAIVRTINYPENPFLTETMKQEIETAQREMDEDDFNHIYLGQPKQDDEDAIIKRKWIMACIDAHIKLDVDITGGKRLGYDVADSGDDLNAYCEMDGGLLIDIITWKGAEDELFESSEKVYTRAVQINADVCYDANGVGAGVGSNMRRLNSQGFGDIDYYGFDSASTPANPDSLYIVEGMTTQQTNREYFENLKAQAWWLLADRIKATYRAVTKGVPIDNDVIISISSELDLLENLITELATPRKKTSGRLKNMVEKKEDLSKRGIKSPNIADAFVMATNPNYVKDKTESFVVKGL